MSTVLRAVRNLVVGHDVHVGEVRESVNRANSLGEAFEIYIKNVFAGAFGLAGTAYQKKIEEVFSYQGSAGKPPDLMIRGGDAIEIKKLQSRDSQIQLNSSFPKNKLHADDSRVSAEAKNAEPWTEKDILYVVGNVDAKSKTVRSMWWIYGDCLIAESPDSFAERIFSDTSARMKFVREEAVEIDSLGSEIGVSLRLETRWRLGKKLADSLRRENAPFLDVLMREEKYQSLPGNDRAFVERLANTGKIHIKSTELPMGGGAIRLKHLFVEKGVVRV